jgi:hypothetical protein
METIGNLADISLLSPNEGLSDRLREVRGVKPALKPTRTIEISFYS